MTPAIIAIRPEPGLSSTIEAGEQAGLAITGVRLFEVEPVSWSLTEGFECDALLVGSANVFRHGGSQLDSLRDIPVHAVGAATAEAAREAGFHVETIGTGGLQSLLDLHDGERVHWLRLAGEEHVELATPNQITLTTRIVYRVKALDLPEAARALFERDCVVLLHSAAAARHFASACERHGINRSHIALAAFGPRILEDVGDGWRAVRSAPDPSESDILALAKNMCETI